MEIRTVVAWSLLALFVGLLLLAAIEDVRRRRIPNVVSAGIALLFLPYALLAPASPALVDALALALLAFLFGWALFARGLLGGGDVKLIAAVILWAGPNLVLPFLLVTSLAGGGLALATLFWRQFGPLLAAGLGTFGENRLASAGAPETLPYGLAIAAGGLLVAFELATGAGV